MFGYRRTLCVNRRRQNSWWKCLGSSSSSSDALGLLDTRGPCVCMTLGGVTPLAQGGVQILGTIDGGDVSTTMHDKFPPSPINSGWCLSSVHRQSGGYCRYAAETGRRHPCHGAVADSSGPFAIGFPKCSTLIRCLMSLLRRSSRFVRSRVRRSRSHSCSSNSPGQVVARPLLQQQMPMVVAVHRRL